MRGGNMVCCYTLYNNCLRSLPHVHGWLLSHKWKAPQAVLLKF